MSGFLIICLIIALFTAGIVAVVKMQDRAENVIIMCPICHEKIRLPKTYVRSHAAKQTLKEFAKKRFICAKHVQRLHSGGQRYETIDVGYGADLTHLFLTNAFVKSVFMSADQLRLQNENVRLLIDTIDTENREFEEAVRASYQKLLP